MTQISLRRALMTSTIVAGILSIGTPALAQTTETAKGANNDEESTTAIVVTGSRIRRDQFTAAEPVTVINRDAITEAGFASATDALQSSGVTAGVSQINNYFGGFVVDGGTGVNTVNLRGLGPTRTLVLLNGRRLAPAGTRGAVGAVDLNVLPNAIIDHIDILKAGASSVYGSDAVAGVVNIITEKKLDGFGVELQTNVPEVGAGTSYRLSATFGYNSDRFHLAASADYFTRDALTQGDRDFARCPINGFVTGPGAALGSGDFLDPATGAPKCFPLDNGGVTVNTLGVSSRPATPAAGTTGVNFTRLRPNAAVLGGTPGYEGVSLNSRTTFDPDTLKEELLTPVEIYTGFLQSSYETDILGNAEFYVELLGNRRKSSAKLFRQLSLDYPVGSPLIPAQFQNSNVGFTSPTSNGQNVGVRAFIGYGILDSQQTVDYVKASGGVRGDISFFKGWRYDAYASNSWTDGRYSTGSFITSRLTAATNVQTNPDGSFSCAVGASAGCVAAPALTPAVIGGDLPQAFRDYIVADVTGVTKFREFNAAVNFDGPLFALPGGNASLSVGAEYRRSRIDDTPPPESVNGDLLNLTAALPTRGSDSVWEVFGEIYLPLLSDLPFAYRLNLTGSARYTNYRSYGGNSTYKIAGEYEPVRGLAFRGSYGTSYRAPALFEQFLGATSGFQSQQFDPCNDYDQSGDANLITNCTSEGLPAGFQATQGVTILAGGGAASGLEAETSKNLSVGAVLRPKLPASIGEFSFAVDYFNIKVENGVAQVGEQNILSRCYTSPTDFAGDTGFCRLVSRDAANGNALTVNNNYFNTATQKVRGIEFNARLARNFGEDVRFTIDASVNHFYEQSAQLFADEDKIDFNGIIGTPDWTGSLDTTLRYKKVKIRYGLDWVGGDKTRTYAYYEEDPATSTFQLSVPDYFLHSMSVSYDADKFSLTAGVRNLLDRDPPRVSTTFGQVYSLVGNAPLYSGYDYFGRTFFVNVSANF